MAVKELRLLSKVLIAIFIVAGTVYRWCDLELRPLHHDESIHVMFGKYFEDNPDTGFYHYDPEYHGPLLYTALRYGYTLFGERERTARGIIAVMGTLLLFLPLALRRYLNERALVALTGVIAFSPTMIFWSRFVREDMFVLFGMALVLYGVLAAPARWKSLAVMFGVVFQYASKENSYVTMALFWGYCLCEYLWRRYIERKDEPIPCVLFAPLPFASVLILRLGLAMDGTKYHMVEYSAMHVGALSGLLLVGIDLFRNWSSAGPESSLVVRMLRFLTTHRISFLASTAAAALFFCYLFSGGWRYPEGILDGLYRKGITYWLEKHDVERIKGPFLFHLYIFSWYELLFMLAVLGHAVHFALNNGRFVKWLSIFTLGAALLIGFFNIPHDSFDWREPAFFVWKKFKLKDWMDISGFILLLAYPLIVTLVHAARRQWNLCFWGYWFTASFFTYSYLGEKVPWLSMYPLTAGYCYFTAYCMALSNGQVMNEVSASRMLRAFGFLLIGITAVFVPIYVWRTINPNQGLFRDYPQLLSQSGAVIVAALVLLLMGQIERKSGFSRRPAFLWCMLFVYVAFSARIAYRVNYIPEYFELGYISQVHTTTEIVDLAKQARAEAEKPGGDKTHRILVEGDSAWPLVWYFRDLPAYAFDSKDPKTSFYYIFQNTDAASPPEFNRREIGLRGWWVPDFRELTLFRFMDMALNLQIWGGNGFSKVAYLEKKAG